MQNNSNKARFDSRYTRSTSAQRTKATDDVEFDVAPSIPAALPDGTLPLAAFDSDLEILAPAPSEPGFVPFPDDVFTVVINGDALDETSKPYPDKGEDPMHLYVPKAVLQSLADGIYSVAYRLTSMPSGDYGTSRAKRMVVDRSPAGGRLLPRIIFDEAIERSGLSLLDLLSMPSGELIGTIPDYRDQQPGDELLLMLRKRGDETPVEIGRVDPNVGAEATRITYARKDLEKVKAEGVVEFFYYVKDKSGTVSSSSPVTPLRLWVSNAPSSVEAPVAISVNDGLITDTDVRPTLSIEIPAPTPRLSAGDVVALRIGRFRFAPIELTSEDVIHDPMLSIDIAYDDVWRWVEDPAKPVFSQEMDYDLVHQEVRSASRSLHATFDLTLPAGRDPVPGTIEHEGFHAPVLLTKSGAENVVSLEDSLQDATIIIPTVTPNPDQAAPFAAGDIVRAYLDGVPFGETVTVEDQAQPLRISVNTADLQASPGVSALTYTVVRPLSERPHEATARSPGRIVVIHAAGHLPGGKDGLNECLLPAAKRRSDSTGFYGLRPQDFAATNTTPIRIYSYRNMAEGDNVVVSFEGFDAYDGGKPVPGSDGTASYTVLSSDLVLREDDASSPGTKAVFFDVPLPLKYASATFRGRMELTYTATNEAGSATSPVHNVIIDVRM